MRRVASRRWSGRACCCARSTCGDHDAVARGPRAQPRLVGAVGAAAGARARPTPSPTATPSGRAAARGSASASSTPRTGSALFLRDGTLVGEVSLGSVLRGPFQSSFIGYWIDEAHAGNGYMPEARRARAALRVRRARAAPHGGGDRAPQRQEPAGRREARPARRGHRDPVPADPAACGRTTCATRSPARSGTSVAPSSRRSSSLADVTGHGLPTARECRKNSSTSCS